MPGLTFAFSEKFEMFVAVPAGDSGLERGLDGVQFQVHLAPVRVLGLVRLQLLQRPLELGMLGL